MNKMKFIGIRIFLFFGAAFWGTGCGTKMDDQTFPIQVFLSLPENYKSQDIRLNIAPSDFVMYPTFSRNKPQIKGTVASWLFRADKPLVLNAIKLLGPEFQFVLLEPGDSIVIAKKAPTYKFSGRGFEKFQLLSDLNNMQQQKKAPKNEDYTTVYSLEDFEEWNAYSNEISDGTDSILSIFEGKIAYPVLNAMKEYIYSYIEYKRLTKFDVLVRYQDTLQIPSDTLDKIFDAMIANKNWKWLSSYTGTPSNYFVYYDLARRQVQRIHHFDLKNDTLLTVMRKVECARLIEERFDGYVEESALTFLVADQGMKDHWYKEGKNEPLIDSLLKAYYARPGYESYKAYMRRYEAKVKQWIVDKKRREQNQS